MEATMNDKNVTVLTDDEPTSYHYQDDRQVHFHNDDYHYHYQMQRHSGWGSIGDMLWSIIQIWGAIFWIFCAFVAFKACTG
jgi:hypothetical protein